MKRDVGSETTCGTPGIGGHLVCEWSKSLRAEHEIEGKVGLACLGIELGGEGAVAGSRDLHVEVTRAARIHAGDAGLEAVLPPDVGQLAGPVGVIILSSGVGLPPFQVRALRLAAGSGRCAWPATP